MTNPYVNSCTKTTEKKTSAQIDEVEKFMQNDVRKMNITDNIRFSRLEQLNNQSSRSLSLYKL